MVLACPVFNLLCLKGNVGKSLNWPLFLPASPMKKSPGCLLHSMVSSLLHFGEVDFDCFGGSRSLWCKCQIRASRDIMSYLPNTTQLGLAGIASFCRHPASFVAQTSQVWCRNSPFSRALRKAPPYWLHHMWLQPISVEKGCTVNTAESKCINQCIRKNRWLANWVTSFFSLWLQYLGKLIYFINLNLEVCSHFGMIPYI